MTEGWVCAPSCPIRLLDEQAGVRRSAGHYPSEAETVGMFGHRKQGQLYADQGGASRFFQTFPPEEESMPEGWECVEGCPVLELGRQSGNRPGYRSQNHNTPNDKFGYNAYGTGMHLKLGKSQGYDDQGTAARFFMQFGEDNLIEPVQETSARIIQGDCVEEMRAMPENSVDSVVTDPPYGLEFMGKEWDKLSDVKKANRGTQRSWKRPEHETSKAPKFQNDAPAFNLSASSNRKMQEWHEAWAREALRVLKPGGYLLAFGGTRTVHRLTCAIEDAGFEIRDRYLNIGGDATESIPGEIAWVYGSGFPKSANIEKLMTKAQGQKRRAHGMVPLAGPQSAQMHSGIGSATKPAYEPIVCARKPLSEKNLVQNILKHGEWLENGTVYKVGTGGLNIDASRVGYSPGGRPSDSCWSKNARRGDKSGAQVYGEYANDNATIAEREHPSGRFPSNTLWSHVPGPNGCVRVGSRRVKGNAQQRDEERIRKTEFYGSDELGSFRAAGYADPDGLEEVAAWECQPQCPVKALDEQSGERPVSGTAKLGKKNKAGSAIFGSCEPGHESKMPNDKGGASRFFSQFHEPGFFYSPKASKRERQAGLDGMPEVETRGNYGNGIQDNRPHTKEGYVYKSKTANVHPTVKPLSLMRYLLRLVTPPGGITLDPFAGSGTTGVAALTEGFNAILIEQSEEYAEIAERRCAHALLPEAEQAKAPKPTKARNTYFKGTQTVRRCAKHGDSIPSGVNAYGCGCPLVYRKDEAKTAKEWGLENVHPQDTPLRYNPNECPEEGGTFEPVEESWEDKRTGPEPDDLTYGEVVEKFATALAKTEEQFKDKLF